MLTEELYFITTTVVDWIDIFTRPKYKHIVIDSLTYCQQQKGLKIYAWVLMSNHLHIIVSAEDKNRVAEIMRDFKKHTYRQKLNYIHNNPVKQEFVIRPEEYLYSSAKNYAGEKGLLEVIVLV